jgi:hypothetical protein
MNLKFGYRFTGYNSPIAGEIEWIHNPALDNLSENRLTDSFVGQFPIESYTYMIMDVTDTATSNIAARTNDVKYRVDDGFNDGATRTLIIEKARPSFLGLNYIKAY